MRYFYQHFIIDPFIWLMYYFFQPTKFKNEFDMEGLFELKHILLLLQLMLPLFVISYPWTLLLRFILFKFVGEHPVLSFNGAFLVMTAIGTLLGMITGMALGTIAGKTGI